MCRRSGQIALPTGDSTGTLTAPALDRPDVLAGIAVGEDDVTRGAVNERHARAIGLQRIDDRSLAGGEFAP
jgi:hypothetical protein